MKLSILSLSLSYIAMNSDIVAGEYEKSSISVQNAKKNKVPLGKDIIVKFEIADFEEEKDYYIAILKAIGKPEDEPNNISVWAGTCSESHWGECSRASDVITFSAIDTIYDDEDTVPLHPGRYRACIMEPSRNHPDVRLACQHFKVKNMPKKHIDKASVTALKESYTVGENIDGEFFTKRAVVKQWIGIYPLSEVESQLAGEEKELPEDKIWIFTGCNNQKGDTLSSGCSIKARKGEVLFSEETLDKFDYHNSLWPLDPDHYVLCIVFTYDRPYYFWKCSDSFEVHE